MKVQNVNVEIKLCQEKAAKDCRTQIEDREIPGVLAVEREWKIKVRSLTQQKHRQRWKYFDPASELELLDVWAGSKTIHEKVLRLLYKFPKLSVKSFKCDDWSKCCDDAENEKKEREKTATKLNEMNENILEAADNVIATAKK